MAKLFMRLQDEEDFASAHCDCILQRSAKPGMNGVPEFLMCPMHESADEMLKGLKRCRDYWQEVASQDELNAPKWLDQLISKAEG